MAFAVLVQRHMFIRMTLNLSVNLKCHLSENMSSVQCFSFNLMLLENKLQQCFQFGARVGLHVWDGEKEIVSQTWNVKKAFS